MKNSGKKPTKKTSILKQVSESLGGLATHHEKTTEIPVKELYFGTHKAPERQEGQGTAGGEEH
jgi:hypothetical protein